MKIVHGNIFDSQCYWLVCPVNCVPGVMGAGLAKQFCFHFSEGHMKHCHREACEKGMSPGSVYLHECIDRHDRKHGVVFFPTKNHWKCNSKLEWIQSGLESLKSAMNQSAPQSIAFPPLGCGLGGLQESDVFPLIEEFSKDHECEYYTQ